MILIDTDHATFLKFPESETCKRLVNRLTQAASNDRLGVAIVTIEERMRGWLAAVAKEKAAARQVIAYRELGQLFEFYQEFEVVQFDESAARQFEELRSQRLRLGTMDLKIASIALASNALLLSANLRHFGQVPKLRVENWLV